VHIRGLQVLQVVLDDLVAITGLHYDDFGLTDDIMQHGLTGFLYAFSSFGKYFEAAVPAAGNREWTAEEK
jgi:hypothetical protein